MAKQAEISLQKSEKSYNIFVDNSVKVLFVNINFLKFGQNIVKNSQVKTFNVDLTRNTVHLEAGSGNHTLLFN
jgi:hypothetical protein